MSAGRPRKPVETLKLIGTFRKDRHADRGEPQAEGEPVCPPSLTGYALEHWNEIVPQLVKMGAVKAIDTSALTACCDMWARYRTAAEVADQDVLDRANRRAMLEYYNAWESAAAKLGLTPADRTRLRVEAAPKEKSRVWARDRKA